MILLQALFGKSAKKPRKTLRSVAVTTPSGRTVIIPDALLENDDFKKKSSQLEKLAEQVVPLQPQTAH